MSLNKALTVAMLIAITLVAAVSTAQVIVHPGPPAPSKPVHLEPCWQVAGVTKSAMQERRAIERRAHQEVEAVCANTSLSVQQRRQQLKQIHQQERQQVEAVITPAQQEAMKSCQQSRGHGGHAHAGGGGHGGPCGEMSASHKNTLEEDETPSEDTPHPN